MLPRGTGGPARPCPPLPWPLSPGRTGRAPTVMQRQARTHPARSRRCRRKTEPAAVPAAKMAESAGEEGRAERRGGGRAERAPALPAPPANPPATASVTRRTGEGAGVGPGRARRGRGSAGRGGGGGDGDGPTRASPVPLAGTHAPSARESAPDGGAGCDGRAGCSPGLGGALRLPCRCTLFGLVFQ